MFWKNIQYYILNEINNFKYKKIIDIPDEIFKPLKIMAVEENRDLKNYIQDLLVNHIRKSR